MRSTSVASLVLMWLLLVASWAHSGTQPERAAPAPRPVRVAIHNDASKTVVSLEAEGFGETSEDAYQDAVKSAQVTLLAYLKEQDPGFGWQPSLKYVRERLIKEHTDEEPQELERIGKVAQHVRVKMELSSRDFRYLQQQDRQVRAEHRMVFFGKFMAGLVALLSSIAVYFRLEEATKGYYTAWLRLAAIGFVGAVGAGIWLVS